MKKLIAFISGLAMCASALTAPVSQVLTASAPLTANAAEEVDINYAEALQKSMFFYEVQQCGELPDWNFVQWRDDAMVNDVVPGGWFDAGDHLKITHTNAYTAAILAWGLIEYGDAVKEAGLYDLYRNNLQWGLDYVAAADDGDKVYGLIADDAFDHVWWGSAEVYMRKYVLKGGSDPRPYDEITCTSTVSQMAAALAAGYIVFKEEDPALAENYLTHAKSLFALADSTRSNEDQGQTAGGNYYKCSDYYDDLFYAANWMYKATGEQKYLDLCESDYIPNLATEEQSTERKFTWGFCWDDALQAAALLYYQNTGKDEWKQQVYKHLEYWTTGYGGKQVQYTPDGMAWLFQWGSARHMTTTAWLAKLASDTVFVDDAAKQEKYNTWVDGQMQYIFGNNDLGLCYVLGMGEKNANSFHHRTASGVWDDQWTGLGNTEKDTYKEYAHVLYGALEGGPNQDGSFTDDVGAYQNTEVAIDYNAGYTALLCAMIADKGGKPLADFPPTETPKWAEFAVAAKLQQDQPSYTQIQVWAMNHSAWPTRVVKDLSYNYYFDVTELLDAGLSVDNITASVGYDQHAGEEGAVSVSKPIQYDGNIYYIKISFNDGRVVMPTGQSEHRSEAQIRIAIPDAIEGKSTAGAWDSSNDYSAQELGSGQISGQDYMESVTPYITMYDGDTLIWGTEPDGTTASTDPYVKPTDASDEPGTDPATDAQEKEITWGDADEDGDTDIIDVICVNKDQLGSYTLTADGFRNADVDCSGDMTFRDAVYIMQSLVDLVTLPVLTDTQ